MQTGYNPSFWDQLLGGTNPNTGVQTQGFLQPTIEGLGGLAQSWLGFQQLGLAKDQFNFQKDAFTQQYNQQATDVNRQLADRQRARLGANPGGYQSVGEYIAENGARNFNE